MTFWDELYTQSQLAQLDNNAMVSTQFNQDLQTVALVDTAHSKWVTSPAAGVVRLLLERDGGEQATRASSLVAYQANSQFKPHHHPEGEEFIVLAGIFSDEHGDYPVGSYVRNPPGSSHQPFSRKGCLIFVKLQQFALDDRRAVVAHIDQGNIPIDEGWSRTVLFDDYERVEIFYAGNIAKLAHTLFSGGVELLILSGSLADEKKRYREGHWLRLPADYPFNFKATAGTQLWIKSKHLIASVNDGENVNG